MLVPSRYTVWGYGLFNYRTRLRDSRQEAINYIITRLHVIAGTISHLQILASMIGRLLDGSKEIDITFMHNAFQIIRVEHKTTNNCLDNVLTNKEINRILVYIEVRVNCFLVWNCNIIK